MTDTLLALIPSYGLWLIFGCVCLSCLAVPLPSSVLLLSAGGFAAAGDLVLWQVIAAAYLGFVIGDQIAFGLARKLGPRLLNWLRKRRGFSTPLARAESMLSKRGGIAVFLCHTVFSPVGPYMNYICGAVGLNWFKFVAASLPGAALWVSFYAYLGFGLMARISQYADLLWSILGVTAALAVTIGSIWWLRRSYKLHKAEAGQTVAA